MRTANRGNVMTGILLALIAIGGMGWWLVGSFIMGCESGDRAKLSRVRADMRSLATAVERYFVDYKQYPVASTDPANNEFAMVANSSAYSASHPTYALRGKAGQDIVTLTTPIAYITAYPKDVLSPLEGAPFCYWRFESADEGVAGWIIWSAGPDRDYDLTAGNVAEHYSPLEQIPSGKLIDATYDPTNGTESNGDVWRVKQ